MLLGALLACASTICFNSGLVIEKRALLRLPEIHAARGLHMLRTLASSPLWLLGFMSSLAGLGLQVLALSRAPLSVVQPILAAGIVWLLLLSHFVLHEHLGRRELGGVAVVVVAILCVGASLDTKAERLGTAASFWRIVLAALPTVALSAVSFVAAGRRSRGSAPLFGLAAGLMYGVAGLATKGVSVIVETDGLIKAIPKTVASPDLYLLGAFGLIGLMMFQTGLQRGRASVVVPVSNVISTAYPIGVGMVLFGEQFPHAAWRLALRAIGFAGVAVGTFVLASGKGLAAVYATEEEPVDIEIEAAASAM
jgi:drug/metabolite transporter (DMT)-like permease